MVENRRGAFWLRLVLFGLVGAVTGSAAGLLVWGALSLLGCPPQVGRYFFAVFLIGCTSVVLYRNWPLIVGCPSSSPSPRELESGNQDP